MRHIQPLCHHMCAGSSRCTAAESGPAGPVWLLCPPPWMRPHSVRQHPCGPQTLPGRVCACAAGECATLPCNRPTPPPHRREQAPQAVQQHGGGDDPGHRHVGGGPQDQRSISVREERCLPRDRVVANICRMQGRDEVSMRRPPPRSALSLAVTSPTSAPGRDSDTARPQRQSAQCCICTQASTYKQRLTVPTGLFTAKGGLASHLAVSWT